MAIDDRGTVVRSFALDVAAVTSFVLTLWLAYSDKASSATVTGLMAVGFTALRYLPLIDTIEAFGMKAKLRQTVNEADGVLDNLRLATATASRLAYFQLGYIGRWGSPTWRNKLDLLEKVDASLVNVGVEPAEAAALREPLMRFAVADIYYLVRHVVSERLQQHRRRLQQEHETLFQGKLIDPEDPNFKRLRAETGALKEMASLGDDLMSHPRLPVIGAFIMDEFRASGLPPADVVKCEHLVQQWSETAQGVWDTKQISAEALRLMDARDSETREQFVKLAFGESEIN